MRVFVFAALLLAACVSTPPAPVALPSTHVSPVAAALAPGEGASFNPADAPAGAYTLDPRHASVTWRIRHMGLGIYAARFDTFSGTLNFDPQAPQNSTVTVTIAANSVSTGLVNAQGQRGFDREIAATLGAEANPNIEFVSRSIDITGPTTGLITGDLTLNGQTHPVVLEASFGGGRFVQLRSKHVVAFSGRTVIRRSQWGVNNWRIFAGDDVEILIEAEFVKD